MSLTGFIAVGGGAAAGAWLRWLLGMMLNSVFPTLPLGTLAANLIGGYLMGLAMGFMSHYETMSPEMRLLLTTGFLGGLTTFSSFSAETVTLLARNEYGWTALLVVLHVAGSVLLTLAGIETVRLLVRA
ncbi:MAG: fluoride efflux transporter CrcB [Proteobacteria bacterium]|nr:fluoride efflux transporter CrcB [Pseudomonadota bacterium]